MHPSALKYGQLFFEKYCNTMQDALVCDIGAQNVNGSLKDVMPAHLRYLGVDFVEGNGVDVILDDPYQLPFEDEKFDAIVCSSCFEHSEFFWLVFLELLRVLKPHGVLYLNVPSNGSFHRYPVDCWRFYPDAGGALESWGKRSGYQPKLLESFIGACDNVPVGSGGAWHDFVGIFVKDEAHAAKYTQRITSTDTGFFNALTAEQRGSYANEHFISPDHQFAAQVEQQLHDKHAELVQRSNELHARNLALQEQGVQLHQLQQQLQAQQQQNQQLQASLNESVALLNQMTATVEAIRSTVSWRVTKPLRWVKTMLS